MAITLTYYGHSCFVLEKDGYRIALDPYDSHVPGYPPLKITAQAVYCSHGHMDHAYTDAVTITAGGENPFTVKEYDIPHDDAGGSLRGMNTIRVFEAEGLRIAHFGDIGCELPPDYVKALKGLDVAMVPVGGFYTIDAVQAKALRERIAPKVLVPMHYRRGAAGFDVIAGLADVCAVFGIPEQSAGRSLTVTADMPAGIVILDAPQA